MNMTTTDKERQVTVLFADVSESMKLYASEGDKVAAEAIARCVDKLRQYVESSGGRVVKTIGDEVMAVFATPDAAAIAAGRMQHAIDEMLPVGASKLAVRIGFHCGPVIQNGSDVFGDTVNLAARLVEQAGRSQIITSHETANKLGPIFRSFKRPLYAIHVKGKAEEIMLCELIWRHADDVTLSYAAGRSIAVHAPLGKSGSE
jgi:adenylate cyclase